MYKESRCSGNIPNLRPVQGTCKTVTEQRPREVKRYYLCNSPSHLAKQCRAPKTENKGDGKQKNYQHKPATAQKVEISSSGDVPDTENQDSGFNLMDILYSSSDSDSGDVRTIRVQDEDSKLCCA